MRNWPPAASYGSTATRHQRLPAINGVGFTDSIRPLIPCDKSPSHKPLLTERQRSKHIGNDKSASRHVGATWPYYGLCVDVALVVPGESFRQSGNSPHEQVAWTAVFAVRATHFQRRGRAWHYFPLCVSTSGICLPLPPFPGVESFSRASYWCCGGGTCPDLIGIRHVAR